MSQELIFNHKIRTKELWNITRSTPTLYLVVILTYFLINPSYLKLYLLVSYLGLNISNHILKQIFKIIYKLTVGVNQPMGILGLGRRPDKATDCASFLNFNNIKPKTYGMPSGHSQLSWCVVTYLLLHIYSKRDSLLKDFTKNNKLRKMYLIIISLILITFATLVSYSRVYVEHCHTLQQVIVGGIIGIIFGFVIYYLQKKFKL